MPTFAKEVENATVPVGREAVLSCVIYNLGNYKVCRCIYSLRRRLIDVKLEGVIESEGHVIEGAMGDWRASGIMEREMLRLLFVLDAGGVGARGHADDPHHRRHGDHAEPALRRPAHDRRERRVLVGGASPGRSDAGARPPARPPPSPPERQWVRAGNESADRHPQDVAAHHSRRPVIRRRSLRNYHFLYYLYFPFSSYIMTL